MTDTSKQEQDSFAVLKELSRDSAGVTYLAEQRSSGRRVAVKLLTVDPQTVRSQFRPTVVLALLIPLAAVSFWLGTLHRGKPDVIEVAAQPTEFLMEPENEAETVAPVGPATQDTLPENLMREALQPEAAKHAKLTHIPLTGTQVNFLGREAPSEASMDLTDMEPEKPAKPAAPSFTDPAFFAAAKNGDLTELKRLLATGIAVNAEDLSGNTALMTAVFNRQPEVVRYLLTLHPDLTHKNRFGQSAADFAAGQPEMEKMLQEAAAKAKP
ncbi:MAG: ankyrin repeat domain-containing protein [Lentisphaeria bacterium]|nr:ankyrin repeat domain-containing protein [Lentisphaeria bacterium]